MAVKVRRSGSRLDEIEAHVKRINILHGVYTKKSHVRQRSICSISFPKATRNIEKVA